MQFKKGWPGYLNLIFGAGLMSVYLYTLFVSFFEKVSLGEVSFFDVTVPLSLIVIICAFVIVLGLFFTFSFIKSKILKTTSKAVENIHFILANICIFALLLYGVYIKLVYIWENTGNTSVFDTTLWNRLISYFYGNPVFFNNPVHNLYTYLCVLILKLFGFKAEIVLYSNLFLFTVSIALIAMSIRWIFGNMAAVFTFAFMMYSPLADNMLTDLNGGNLWVLFVAILFMNLSFFIETVIANYPVTSFLVCIGVIVFAASINHFVFIPFNFVPYFDYNRISSAFYPLEIVNIVFAIFGLYAFLSFLFAKKDKVTSLFTFILLVTLLYCFDTSDNYTFVFFLASLGAVCGRGFEATFFEGYKIIIPVTDEGSETEQENSKNGGSKDLVIENIDLSEELELSKEKSLAGSDLPKENDCDNSLSDMKSDNSNVSENNSDIDQISKPVDLNLNINSVTDNKNLENCPGISSKDEIKPETVSKDVENKSETVSKDDENKSETVSKDDGNKSDTVSKDDENKLGTVTKNVENKLDKKEIKFIENPLPLPKKHEKKTMEFPYKFNDNELEFDYEIKSNDDFDY